MSDTVLGSQPEVEEMFRHDVERHARYERGAPADSVTASNFPTNEMCPVTRPDRTPRASGHSLHRWLRNVVGHQGKTAPVLRNFGPTSCRRHEHRAPTARVGHL